MTRDESATQERLDAIEKLDPEELQAHVDACETEAALRYRRLQGLISLVTGALRHAEAMGRLELALRRTSTR
jgi:hypothetical protein